MWCIFGVFSIDLNERKTYILVMAVGKDKGKWFYYGSIYENGKIIKRYKKRGFKTKREALNSETDFLREWHEKKSGKPDWDILVSEYLKVHKLQVKASSLISDESVYKKIPEYVKSDYLNRELLQAYIQECDNLYSKRHVEKIYYCLRKLFNFGIDYGFLEFNPMTNIIRDSRKNEKEKEIQFWELEDFEKFIKEIDNPIYHACFMTLYYMGIRKGEMQALTWKDIDFKNKTMTINKIISHKHYADESPITTPKTKNSYRTITIPDILIHELQDLYTLESDFNAFSDDSFVFGTHTWVKAETLRITLKNGILKANVKPITVHGFRHSHASYLINNMGRENYSDYDIAQRLGDTVETLHRVYAHWFVKKDKEIVEFMNKKK